MDRRAIVDIIAERLEQILPCYSLGSRARWSDKCNSGLAVIEALQIEGHTDADGSAFNNMVLSTARANSTFAAMTDREPGLIDHLNFRNQPVISVAGYGEMRPVAPNDSPEDKATNRRMDLRIIMYVPRQTEEIERIREKLSAGLSGEQP
ncbi:hypothetical protein CNY89_15745 [Amaricoccus sp. HAR-UPW-R2A-40]|nr:hypothetical protein CNY89_15745 [Amaricoccus sp. HAR-UPW-R2A-40]